MATLKERTEKRLNGFLYTQKTGKKPPKKKTPEQLARMEAGKKARKANFPQFLGLKICKESNTRKTAREKKKTNQLKLVDRPNEFNNYDEFMRIYHNNEVCKKDFERTQLKLNGLPGCPRCNKETKVTKIKTRPRYYCKGCKRQFSITTGTVFFKMKLPRQKFYKLMFHENDDRNGQTYEKIAERLNVPIYTGYLAAKKFRATGFDQKLFRIFSGSEVVVDTLSSGGLNSNRPDHKKLTTEECFAAQKHAVAIKAKNGNARVMATLSREIKEVQPVITGIVGNGSVVHSDEGTEFAGLEKLTYIDKDGITKPKYICIKANHSAGDHGQGDAESLIGDVKQFIENHSNNVSKGNFQLSLNHRVFHGNTKHLTTCQKFKLSLANLGRHDKPQFENKKVRRRSTFAKIARIKYASLLEKVA